MIAPMNKSTAVIVPTICSVYGRPQIPARDAYRVASAGRIMVQTVFRISYSLLLILNFMGKVE